MKIIACHNDKVTKKNDRISLDYGQENEHLYVSERIVDKEVPVHWHTYFELEIIVDGEGIQLLNDEETELRRGCAYILNPTDFHKIIPKTPLRLWNVSFDEEMINERMLCQLSSQRGTRRFMLSEDVLERLCALCGILYSESLEAGGGASHELCEGLLNILLRGSTDKNTSYQRHIKGISRAILYLEVHFRENPSLDQLATQAGFNTNYFCELFKKVTGESYLQRLNTLRTGYAKMLLSQGFSVTESCFQSGFGSLSNFLTVFKKQTGISPSEYRKENQG